MLSERNALGAASNLLEGREDAGSQTLTQKISFWTIVLDNRVAKAEQSIDESIK